MVTGHDDVKGTADQLRAVVERGEGLEAIVLVLLRSTDGSGAALEATLAYCQDRADHDPTWRSLPFALCLAKTTGLFQQ